MKKALFITTISGFLPQFEKNDVKILQEMGYEVHYASNFKNPVYACDQGALKKDGIVLHQVDIEKNPMHWVKNIKATLQIKKVIDQNEIELIHCHNPMGGVAGRIAAVISRCKPTVIYTAHGFHFYKGASAINWVLFYTAERLLAHFTDVIVTINQEDKSRAEKFRLKKQGKVFQIHSVGVDKDRFSPRKCIETEKRKILGIDQDAFHIVTAAQLNKNKNQRVIIEAMAKLQKENIYFSICGEGPEQNNLERLVVECGLYGKVRLLGYRTDMEEILQTADCFAFPSYREGLGIAAIEALLCGVPLLAADNRGTREYARDGYNAFVCEADSIDGFANAINALYTDRIRTQRMADSCRESALPFTIEEVEQTMRKVYEYASKTAGVCHHGRI